MVGILVWRKRRGRVQDEIDDDVNDTYGTYHDGVEYNTVNDSNDYYGKDDPANVASEISDKNSDYATITDTTETNKNSVPQDTTAAADDH